MSSLKLVVWNMEWMNDLFDPNAQAAAFRADGEEPPHSRGTTVRKRRDDLSAVLNELAADVVVVVEGPNRTDELQLFFDQDVQGDWKAWVQPSPRQSQCIGIAARIDQGKLEDAPFTHYDTADDARFAPFLVDTDDDGIEEQHEFERRPLYVEINPQSGRRFRVLGLHLKSKGIFDAYEWSKWWQTADGNRRRLLAQVTQLRLRFLDPYLTDEETKSIPMIVCGDVNDGPGLDAGEKRLFGSAIERLMGTVWKPELCLRNTLFEALSEKARARLDFATIVTTSYKDPIFNNTWHREWIDHVLYTDDQGAAWVSNAQVHSTMADGSRIWARYKHASDHFPVSVTVTT